MGFAQNSQLCKSVSFCHFIRKNHLRFRLVEDDFVLFLSFVICVKDVTFRINLNPAVIRFRLFLKNPQDLCVVNPVIEEQTVCFIEAHKGVDIPVPLCGGCDVIVDGHPEGILFVSFGPDTVIIEQFAIAQNRIHCFSRVIYVDAVYKWHQPASARRQRKFQCFQEFFTRNVINYHKPWLPVHFVGSLANSFAEELRETADSLGMTIGKIEASPMSGLVDYHATDNA